MFLGPVFRVLGRLCVSRAVFEEEMVVAASIFTSDHTNCIKTHMISFEA